MNELKNIARIYDELLKNKTSKYIRSGFNEKEEQLFGCLQTDLSDNSISKKIYNTSPSHQSYQSLKRSLLDKLYSIVICSNAGKSYQKQKLDTSREFLVIKVLAVLKLRAILIPMAKKTLKKCQKYHMFHEGAELARILSEHFSVFSKKTTMAKEYYDLAIHCIETYRLELQYGWKYSYFRSLYGSNAFEDSLVEFRQSADELELMLKKGSSRLAFYYYELRFFQYYIQNDNDAIVNTCKQATRYFRSLPFNHESARSIFIFHLIENYLSRKELEQAEELILEFLDETDKKKAVYYRYKELLFCIYLYKVQLNKAEPIFNYLKANIRRLSNIFTRDRLIIYEMYMAIFKGEVLNFRRINYNLNKVKQDKKGLHVPYLMGQAVYYYINDPDKLIDKMDALKQYSYKYLKDDQFGRTKQFIKILDRMIDGRDYDDILLDQPNETINNHGIEIVAYERLLEFIKQKTESTMGSKV